MAHREESILHTPQLPSEDEDAWPTYVLGDVKVWAKHNRRLQPLHHAHPEFPLAVSGILQSIPEECKEYVKNKKGVGNRIQLNEVTKFASGTYGRGKKQRFVLWAFGKTGWFEILPSQKYQAIFNETIEGVKLFYFLCDQYTAKDKQRRPSAKQVFKAYANSPGSQCSDAKEARQLLYKHYYFLISEMINDTQEIGWDKSPIFKDLANTFPEATHNIRLRVLDSSDDELKKTDEDTSTAETQEISESSEPNARESIESTIPQTPKGVQRRKRMRPRRSALRPTSSRPVKSAKSRGKAPTVSGCEPTNSQVGSEDNDENDDDEVNEEQAVSGRDTEETDDETDKDSDEDASQNEDLVATIATNHTESMLLETGEIPKSETDGLLTTERVKIVQSEGQRGARVGNLLDFVMSNAVG